MFASQEAALAAADARSDDLRAYLVELDDGCWTCCFGDTRSLVERWGGRARVVAWRDQRGRWEALDDVGAGAAATASARQPRRTG